MVHERGTFVEGIGDEVIFSIVGLLAAIIPATMMYLRRQGEQTIHPHSRDAVQNTLAQLQHQQSQGGSTQPQTPGGTTQPQTNPRPAPSAPPLRTDRTCPICLAEARFGIETNCGHLFCGECVTTYWRHGNWLGAVRCPVCRQQVTLLLISFTDEERNDTSQERTDIVREIHRYNRRFSGEPISWIDYIRDLPTLLRHCVREFFSIGGLIWMFRLRIIICFFAALLYLISPLDLIPEAVFGLLGLLDDFFVLLLLGIYVSIIYRRVIAARAAGFT